MNNLPDARLDRSTIVIPLYRPQLPKDEECALRRSLPLLEGRPVYFIAPRNLDLSWYQERWPRVGIRRFDDAFFASIRGYNLLLLSPDFYRSFDRHEFMLVLQTDAILLSDELDHWAGQPYDYVGAPWPQPIEVDVELDRFAGGHRQRVRAKVGNGGFSLRRIRKCLALMEEFPQALELFRRSGSSEDLFFAVMGSLSVNFVLPGEMAAAQFSLELAPERYFAVQRRLPMGAHAWRKHNPAFWRAHLADAPLLDAMDSASYAVPVDTSVPSMLRPVSRSPLVPQ
jgi:hypothetical protein